MKKSLSCILFAVMFLVSCGAPASQTVVDPYVAAGQAQGTAQAALRQAEYYGVQLTGTAQAPIIAITQTYASFEIQQAYALATQQSIQATETAGYTATALSWTPTPNATTTAVFVLSNAESTQIANDVEVDNLSVERQKINNTFYAVIVPIFLLALLLCVGYAGISFSRYYRKREVKRDSHGNVPLLVDIVNGQIVDMDANPNYSTEIKNLPAITAERQERQRIIQSEFLKRLPALSTSQTQIEKRTLAQIIPQIPAIIEDEKNLLPLPAWNLINAWDGQKGLPCGINARGGGLEFWDYNELPHLSVFGMTGSGKSRRLLRPIVAGILASNQRVILLGKETDFQPFMRQENAVVIPVYELTERAEALKYAYALAQCVKEKNKRARHLVEIGQSTWQRAGYENTFIVLDEIGNALREMPKDVARESFGHVCSLVNEGRKVGFNVVFSSQRPKSFIDLTTQCGQAVFLVRNDRESGYALGSPGAERLAKGYFFSKFGALKMTGAFEPTDDEIIQFLQSRQIKPLEKPNWIEGVVKQNLIEENQIPLVEIKKPEDPLHDQKIKDLYLGYLNKKERPNLAAIQRAVYGKDDPTGGAHFAYIKKVLEELEGIHTRITTTTENVPVFAGLS